MDSLGTVGGSTSKPNISYEVSYDGGNTWEGPYDNIIYIPKLI